ncbi:hypothetical protein JCM19039_236 [Geomicrobium sp. JCM 19039]|nr:hypothetical protein JCM19039_236 [Geomicrobium sp. JCM 19039]
MNIRFYTERKPVYSYKPQALVTIGTSGAEDIPNGRRMTHADLSLAFVMENDGINKSRL